MRRTATVGFGTAGLVLMVLVGLSVGLLSCDFPSGEHKRNTPPNARLSNVPADDPIALYIRLGSIPEVTLYWAGDDPDGYVTAFRFWWTDSSRAGVFSRDTVTLLNLTTIAGSTLDTLIRVHGTPNSIFRMYNFFATLAPSDPVDVALRTRIQDSLATGRAFAVPYKTGIIPGDSVRGISPVTNPTPTRGLFIFDSPRDSNMHSFQVVAIDNSDEVDPTPARVRFWTLSAPAPIALFASAPPSGRFALRCITERYPGIPVTFTTYDPSTFEQQYSWSVDDTVNWSPWSDNAQAYIRATDFDPIQTGTHRIYLRAKNRWGVVSAVRETTFYAIVPPIDDPQYPKRLLVIHNDSLINRVTPAAGRPTPGQIRDFFREVLDSTAWAGRYNFWLTWAPPPPLSATQRPLPPADTLGKYTSILMLYNHAPPVPPFGAEGQRVIDANEQVRLIDYLNIGGKLVWSGTPRINLGVANYLTQQTGWAYAIFHVEPAAFLQDTARGFVGARGVSGYPDLVLDANDTLKFADRVGALRYINLNYPRGFGESISLFDHGSNNPVFENQPLGVRYLAPPPDPGCRQMYSVVYFGVPLWYATRTSATQLLTKAFRDVNELP
jgi:hypothetical protein